MPYRILQSAEHSAVHLEMRDSYTPDDPDWLEWQAGNRFDPTTRESWQTWFPMMKAATSRGVAVRRARIVSEPVTGYIRFGYDLTAANNVDAGEQVRWLPRRQATGLLVPPVDFWVFDERVVVWNHFAGDGSWVTRERCDDAWLAKQCVCEKERQVDRVREELLAHLRREQVEPPSRDRVRRVIGAALRQAEQALTMRIASRVPAEAVGRMRALIARAADPGGEEDGDARDDGTLFGAAEVTGVDVFAAIREEPGNVSVKTIGQEAFKLGAIRAVSLPDDLFADVAPKVLAGWRGRVAAEAPSHLRSHPPEVMVTLLAAYLYCRQREITDALVDLLIATVHRINARADTKVTSDFVAELKRVSGKENILFKMTEAAVQSPGERVEDVIYPAVPGGHETLAALLREYKANGTSWRQHRQRVFKASCTSHYRTGLIQITEVLESGSADTVHAPMVEALALIKPYKADVPGRVKCYAAGEHVPVDAAAAGDHPHTEDDLRYARRRYLTVDACRQAARIIANATFASRQAALWGEGTTAVASDSTHFSAFDQNIFTSGTRATGGRKEVS